MKNERNFKMLIDRLFLLSAEAPGATAAAAAADPEKAGSIWPTIILFAVLILAMYFIMIRPQKKREKEQKMMREALAVGDEIVTIGGISGTVVAIREDSVVIESGSDRDKVKVMKWAIQSITQLRKTSDEETGSKGDDTKESSKDK